MMEKKITAYLLMQGKPGKGRAMSAKEYQKEMDERVVKRLTILGR